MADARVCIHAHFYQPPRENPWLEAVEPEPSAAPHHDWNARITAECYAPNGAARILDSEGRIESIRNNYASISFNFGPTLLGWLETHAPGAYASVIAADAESVKRFGGHGSALAQPYNHMIMPLASPRDRRTQTLWGVADFKRRFGRSPEGMWLPETAVDIETLEALAECGIRFTILAPHQAARVRAPGGDWEDVGESADSTVAYRQVLPSGREISLFFYDGPASRAVAFEKLLDDGETLASRLAGLATPGCDVRGGLAHIATDGETYGHHHAHGDMALAVALGRIEEAPGLRLTNYAQFLAESPPTHEVQIHENTSWSCAHGVERWRSDCGCSTGGEAGWTQAWRAPLREALDGLSGDLSRLFEERGGAVLVDPWRARDAYIQVVLGGADARAGYLEQWVSGAKPAERTEALRLLEMQRCSMLMYTSCGWFFNDLAGIETRQILRYAARALDLAESIGAAGIREPFLGRLIEARGNGPDGPDGCQVLLEEEAQARVSARDVAVAAAARLAAGAEAPRYRTWTLDGDWVTVTVQGARSVAGAVRVSDGRTLESHDYRCRALRTGSGDLRIWTSGSTRGAGAGEDTSEADLRSLRSETRLAIAAAGQAESSRNDHLAGAIRADMARLADPTWDGPRDETSQRLDQLLASAEAAGADLPLWELQNLWWAMAQGPRQEKDEVEERVGRRLGFADGLRD